MLALAGGMTVAASAERAGMSEATAYRRLADPDVQRQLDQVRLNAVERAMDRLAAFASGAADVLAAIAGDKTAAAAVRVSAASSILRHVLNVRDAVAVESRLGDIEAVLAARERAAADRDRWGVPA